MAELGTYGGASKSAGGEASGGSGVGSIMEAGGLQEDARDHMLEGPEGKYSVGRVVVDAFDYDVATASGTLDITGLGGIPFAIILQGAIASTKNMFTGLTNGVDNTAVSTRDDIGADTWNYSNAHSIIVEQTSPAACVGVVSLVPSSIADGFRITFTKTGSPVGTLNVQFMAFLRG